MDYANSTLFWIPQLSVEQTTKVLNNAARLVTLSSRDCHISDITYNLHWLPIKQRINFKMLLLTFKALNDSAPSYTKQLLKQHHPSRTLLRFSDGFLLTVPKSVHRATDDRSFSYSAIKLWNNLPIEIRRIAELSSFKSAISGLLFNKAYNHLL